MKIDGKCLAGGVASSTQIALINDSPDRSEIIVPSEWIDQFTKAEDREILSPGSFDKSINNVLGLQTSKIGIGITTHNRPEAFRKTMNNLLPLLPEGAELALIDDYSSHEYMYDYSCEHHQKMPNLSLHRFNSNIGIARAKNKALELLYEAGCQHFFLFDDDTYPLVADWWKPYVESREPHLMYIFERFANTKTSPNDMVKVYQDSEIAAYSHVRGCMLYYKRGVLDIVGGMDVSFGKWGHEHGDLSNRIYAAGLTRFRYMDVANSKGLFYAADEQEHGKFVSTVPGVQRIDMLAKTQGIYNAHYNTPVYCEFRERKPLTSPIGSPLFLSAYFTTLPDPQRPGVEKQFWTPDFAEYAGSILRHNHKAMILTDNPDFNIETAIVRHETVPVSINPYFQRWVSYYDYLIRNRDSISWVFMTDCTDVELLNQPEPDPGKIYTGDEPDTIGKSVWLQNKHRHPTLQAFYRQHAKSQMVNAGILGGYIDDVLPFIRAIIDTYTTMRHDEVMKGKAGPGETDMAVFNYVAYTQFADKISYGRHVNTVFKANERNTISWFKHK